MVFLFSQSPFSPPKSAWQAKMTHEMATAHASGANALNVATCPASNLKSLVAAPRSPKMAQPANAALASQPETTISWEKEKKMFDGGTVLSLK